MSPYEIAMMCALNVSLKFGISVSVIPKFKDSNIELNKKSEVGIFILVSENLYFAELFVDALNGTISCEVLI